MNAYFLKLIALFSMFIDHMVKAGIISQPMLMNLFHLDLSTSAFVLELIGLSGRISFPIFAFLIAEGYRHTHNSKRYLFRLLAFAVLSEIPFDLALIPWQNEWYQVITPYKHMNILFTFALAIIGLMLYHHVQANKVHLSVQIGSLLLPVLPAVIYGTDYSVFGMMFVYVSYFCIDKKWCYASMTGVLFLLYIVYSSGFFTNLTIHNLYEWIASCISILFICFYNGKRGKSVKWIFYVAYPLHLLLITLWK